MEASVSKGFVLTTSKTPCQSSDSGGSNENEVSCDELNSNSKLHHPKKPLTKHFMSPTISAATKAAATVPRKKILAERNESSNFIDTHLPKNPNFDSTTSHIKPRFVRSSSSRFTPSKSFDDDEDQNVFVSDSSMKPYDPVTSYTSPRPKFLRYNPNRLHPQNQTCREDLGFEDSQIAAAEERAISDALNSVVSSSQESPTKEDEEEEEEIEDIEKERGLSLKEMLKFLLVIVALFFSTLYISSMNSPNPSPTVEALRDGYYGIQNKVFEAVNLKIFEGQNEPLDRSPETIADAESEENRVEDDENGGLVEGDEELGENVQIEDLSENESKRNWEAFDLLVEEVTEIAKEEDVFDRELENKVESFDHLVVGEDLLEINEGAFRDEEIEKTDAGSAELLEIETVEKFKSFQDHQVIEEEVVVEDETERVEEINGNTLDEFGISQWGNAEESDTVILEADSKEAIINKPTKIEEIDSNSLDESDISEGENEGESDKVSPEADSKEAIVTKPTKIESFLTYIIGVPLFFTIVAASLGLVYWSRHKKSSLEDSPQPTKNPIAKSSETQYQKAHPVAEKISRVHDVVEQEKIKKIEFKAKPSALIPSNEEEKEVEATKEFSHSQAPIVELLSELVIGEVSSSLNSFSGVKSKSLEIEESNNSVFQEKKRSHIKSPSSLLESSVADSPLYGSFTAGKKIAKKEEANDGEVNMLITTPVRRSSRIRNRAVMSP